MFGPGHNGRWFYKFLDARRRPEADACCQKQESSVKNSRNSATPRRKKSYGTGEEEEEDARKPRTLVDWTTFFCQWRASLNSLLLYGAKKVRQILTGG